jgi:flagellin
MAAVLSTNMASLYAQKNLSTAQTSLSESVQRLSSGKRISSAKDDAAGYGISEAVKGTKNIVDQNIRNTQDGISWAQTADGALDVVGKMLQRVMTLTTQGLDATFSIAQQKSIATEIVALYTEIANVKTRTKFQDRFVFAASGVTPANDDTVGTGTLAVNTGATAATTVTATIAAVTAIKTFSDTIAGAGGVTVVGDITTVTTAITANATNRAALGASLNSLQYSVDNMQTLSTNLADGISRIVDTDYAAETANLTRSQILQQAATSMLAQANQMPNVILTLLK